MARWININAAHRHKNVSLLPVKNSNAAEQELDKCDIPKSERLPAFPFSKEDKAQPQMGRGGGSNKQRKIRPILNFYLLL